MTVQSLSISGYRSINKLRLSLQPVNVLTGPNGCGKSNLYRALLILARSARGDFAHAIAEEGGMTSLLWAGARKTGSVRVELEVRVDNWAYDMSFGLPAPGAVFPMEPVIKREQLLCAATSKRRIIFMQREGPSTTLRDTEGRPRTYSLPLLHSETTLSQISEPEQFPELAALSNRLREWRFYHLFRTDADSPIRHAQVGTQTNVLSQNGCDLASALHTISAIGHKAALHEAVDRAFPGARLQINGDDMGYIQVGLQMPGIQRPFMARELSDGTLRYLCLMAILLSPRPPELIALNEPETSLHPDLLPPLGRLIANASKRSQLWITTHSPALAAAIAEHANCAPVELEMVDGETRVIGQGLLDR